MGPGNFAPTFGAGDNRIYSIISHVIFYNLHVILTILRLVLIQSIVFFSTEEEYPTDVE